MKKLSSSSKLRGSPKPLSFEEQVGLLPLRKEAAFDYHCILKPAGAATHSEAKYHKRGFIQNLKGLVAMRTDLTA